MREECFIRYYISEIPHAITQRLEAIITTLPLCHGWQWIPIGKFNYERSRGYLPGPNVAEVECIKRKCAAIVEHPNPNIVIGSSMIWTSGDRSPATLIDDLLTLCSIAESKYINARAVEILLPDNNQHIIHRPVAPFSSLQEIVPPAGLEAFVLEGVTRLQEQKWKHETGFNPAIYWYRQAQQSFHASTFALELSLYWIVLEILGGAYVQRLGLSTRIRNKKERVKSFLTAQGFDGLPWNFLSTLIDECYEVRCVGFHEGRLPPWSHTKFEQLWRQFVEFVSFVLADLIQRQIDEHRKTIASRLSQY